MGDRDSSARKRKKLSREEIYRVAVDTRNFKIKLFWERSNYFLVLNTAIAIGFFSLQNARFAPVLAGFGIVVSYLWFRVNLGGKFWQSRWERRLHIIEADFAPNANLFAADWAVIRQDVTESLVFNQHGRIRSAFNRLILGKPSVSFAMILLSVAFALFWATMLSLAIATASHPKECVAPSGVDTLPHTTIQASTSR